MARLYIVPTPIGNPDDITLRAVNILREVDFVLAEDTRTTSFLLKHLGIGQKLRSHHKFNEHATVQMVAETIAAGHDAALVSDAGTPGISDPGFLLVRTCVEAGIEVETLPGATALIPALVLVRPSMKIMPFPSSSGSHLKTFATTGLLPTISMVSPMSNPSFARESESILARPYPASDCLRAMATLRTMESVITHRIDWHI